MAIRHATRRFHDVGEFMDEYEKTIRHGAISIPARDLPGELSTELRLDLVLPLIGRVGPIDAQLLHQDPERGAGLNIPQLPPQVDKAIKDLLDLVQQVKEYLLATGQFSKRVSSPAISSVPAAQAARPGGSTPVRKASPPPAPSGQEPARGFVLPDLSQMEPSIQGELGSKGFRECLISLAMEHQTGILVLVENQDRRRFGFWYRGGPVGWRTEPLDESEVLGVLLYRAGKLTEEQLAKSLELAEADGIRQGEALMNMGVLSFPQLVMVLQKQVEFILQKVMRLQEGLWAFYPLESLPENFATPPLRLLTILFRALKAHTKEMALESIAASHRSNLDRYVFLADGVESVLEEINFTPAERKFMEIMRSNSWRLRELFSVSNLSRGETAATIWALNQMDFIDYRVHETRERFLARVGTRIQTKEKQLGPGTHFDILEVHWISLPHEIEQSYRRLKKEFAASGRYRDLPPNLEKAVRKISRAIEASYLFLKDDKKRRAYREEVIEAGKIEASAEILAKKGEMAIMKADRGEALNCWGKALELMPGMAAYRDGLERARALG